MITLDVKVYVLSIEATDIASDAIDGELAVKRPPRPLLPAATTTYATQITSYTIVHIKKSLPPFSTTRCIAIASGDSG